MAKNKAYYLALPYTRRVRVEEGKRKRRYLVASIDELPGVEGEGETPEEAHYHLQLAFVDYLDAMIEWGDEIPEPQLWPGLVSVRDDSHEGPAVTIEHVLRPGEEFPWRDARPRWAQRATARAS